MLEHEADDGTWRRIWLERWMRREGEGSVLSRVSSSRHLLQRLHSLASWASSASVWGRGEEGVCMMAPCSHFGGGGAGVSERRGDGVVRDRTAVRKLEKEARKAGDSDSIVGWAGGGWQRERSSSFASLLPPTLSICACVDQTAFCVIALHQRPTRSRSARLRRRAGPLERVPPLQVSRSDPPAQELD